MVKLVIIMVVTLPILSKKLMSKMPMINPYTICDNPKKKNENIIDVNINLDLFDKNLNASFKIHLKNNSVKIV